MLRVPLALRTHAVCMELIRSQSRKIQRVGWSTSCVTPTLRQNSSAMIAFHLRGFQYSHTKGPSKLSGIDQFAPRVVIEYSQKHSQSYMNGRFQRTHSATHCCPPTIFCRRSRCTVQGYHHPAHRSKPLTDIHREHSQPIRPVPGASTPSRGQPAQLRHRWLRRRAGCTARDG